MTGANEHMTVLHYWRLVDLATTHHTGHSNTTDARMQQVSTCGVAAAKTCCATRQVTYDTYYPRPPTHPPHRFLRCAGAVLAVGDDEQALRVGCKMVF